ncbi:hypothetical protein LOTGIDRAFT_173032 [Lottia gigantea]|uniref:Uncharacterized protein n=1 Tax=Lottia gigantea TaxID=225164 RepID=V4B0T4_LOTGI|nr:hypothetical protein LOTGIDRAFT_173032 [Lottia gigantea]ESP00841.1 hypothetical protein LOTGIDRAFT_173032 [Lottia gigantea]
MGVNGARNNGTELNLGFERNNEDDFSFQCGGNGALERKEERNNRIFINVNKLRTLIPFWLLCYISGSRGGSGRMRPNFCSRGKPWRLPLERIFGKRSRELFTLANQSVRPKFIPVCQLTLSSFQQRIYAHNAAFNTNDDPCGRSREKSQWSRSQSRSRSV